MATDPDPDDPSEPPSAVFLRAPAGTPVRAALAAVFDEMFSAFDGLVPEEKKPERNVIDTTATDG